MGGGEAGGTVSVGTLFRATRAVVPTCILILGCATSHIPAQLRHYTIVVQQNDMQSIELARAMREQGVKVRPKVRGGSGPTAALIYFTFSDPGPGQPLWFHIRLADTRSGEIVGAATIQLDSLTMTPRARAVAAVKALTP